MSNVRKPKALICFLAVLLIFITGCNKSTEHGSSSSDLFSDIISNSSVSDESDFQNDLVLSSAVSNNSSQVNSNVSSEATQAEAEWEKKAKETAKKYQTTTGTIDFNKPSPYSKTNAEFYNSGYDGWNDITDAQAVKYLKETGMKQIRFSLDLSAVSESSPDDIDIYYTTAKDVGLNLVERIKLVRSYGWEVLIAPSNNHLLPSYFKGSLSDWYKYNHDGSTTTGISDQMRDYAKICGDTAKKLKEAGITGLNWETFFESDGYGYIVDLHYLTAKAIKEADPTAKITGPATFPGWSVEEGFLKPYLTKYGAEYLDCVSIHLYGSNDVWHRTDLWDYKNNILTMSSTGILNILMESSNRIPVTSKKVREILNNFSYNPTGKKIDISFTEFDANAYSPYKRVPVNASYPYYNIDSDCYINTNYFGGVFTANCILQASVYSPVDSMYRFTTRSYYGLLDHNFLDKNQYYRTPVYFSFMMLRSIAYLTDGCVTYQASDVKGPTDNSSVNISELSSNSPFITMAGIKNDSKKSVIILNKSNKPLNVSLTIKNSEASSANAVRYIFSKHTTADFIGRGEDNDWDGYFENPQNDLLINTCLNPYDRVSLIKNGNDYIYNGVLEGYSYNVLQLN